MLLIADSGSTKTEWAYVNKNEHQHQFFLTQGMNPYFTSDKEINSTLDKVIATLKGKSVEKIVFFGSGCNSTEKGKEMKNLFKRKFSIENIEIHSDLVGAAIALFGDKPGIAVILGTGANSGFF